MLGGLVCQRMRFLPVFPATVPRGASNLILFARLPGLSPPELFFPQEADLTMSLSLDL
jgi:hypothetical protein